MNLFPKDPSTTDSRPRFQPRVATIRGRKGAFNLIEMLVVIAVIAILAALLLPALSKSKEQALRVACLNNLKQLQICNHLYALDHTDRLPPNNFVYDIDTGAPLWGAFSTNVTWCPGLAPYDTTTANIEGASCFLTTARSRSIIVRQTNLPCKRPMARGSRCSGPEATT